MSTIDGTTVSNGVTLGPPGTYTSPLTITGSGGVSNSAGDAVYAAGTYANPTLVNDGKVIGSTYGVDFQDGGSVDNTGTGLIQGYTGVYITGTAGTVTNSATITGTGGFRYGVNLVAGGSVDNSGAGWIQGGFGIGIRGGAGTVTNSGTIAGTGANRSGVRLSAGGSVDNTGTGWIQGYYGVYIAGSTGAVTNSATITGTGGAGSGVFLAVGSVGNSGTGLIQGRIGVNIFGGAGTVTNSATIASTSVFGVGVQLGAGGSVDNNGTGLIRGNTGVYIFGTAGTVTNSATIAGTASGSYGVGLGAGGSVTNDGTGLIQGSSNGVVIRNAAGTVTNSATIAGTGGAGYGVNLGAGGTVVDSGTISGVGGIAVLFGGTGGNLLVLESGYKLVGSVVASGTSNTLELLGAAGSAVTAVYNNFSSSGFADVLFGPNGDATLTVSNTGSLGVTISGFDQSSEHIELTGIGAYQSYHLAGDVLTVYGSGGQLSLQLDVGDAHIFAISDNAAGIDVDAACFCRGTRIRTPDGEVPVEALSIGDLVMTASGAARPVRWVGRRAYDPRFVAGNKAVLPIRIVAGALAEGVPSRDLFLSPEHALVLDGLYLPARELVNGTTICQVEAVERLEYFHVELDSSDVLLAEGATAESFVDFGGRGMFHNAAEFAALHPDAEPADWERYEMLLEAGRAGLPAVRATLLSRAEALGRISRDPDLHLIVDGLVVRRHSTEGRTVRFALPAGARDVRIASRSTVPAESEAASLDPRRLGLPVERIVLSGSGLRIEIGAACPALRDGFHADEGSHRWTDGSATLPAGLFHHFAGEIALELRLGATELHYPTEAADDAPAPDIYPRPRHPAEAIRIA